MPAARAGELRQPPFIIEYHPDDHAIAEHSAGVLGEALREFAPRLPPGAAPIRVAIAHSQANFIARVGHIGKLGVAGVAKSAQGLIIVQSPRVRMAGDDYNGTLRHELLHVLLYRNTDTARLPRWLNEGICMSYANEYSWQGPMAVAKLFFTGRVIPLRYLDVAFTEPGDEQEFSDAYAQALSLVRFMRDELGEETFWRVVLGTRDEDFEFALKHATGWYPVDLWDAYQRSLWVVAILGTLASGSFFGPAAVLVIIAWWRIRGRNQRRLAQMAEQERGAPIDVSWAEVGEEHEAEDDAEGRPAQLP